MENASERVRKSGFDAPEPFLGNEFIANVLKKHYAAIVGTEVVAVPDDDEEMNWRLFFAHSQDMRGFRADIFTGGWNEARNPYDANFRGLRARFPSSVHLIVGLGQVWLNPEAREILKRASHPFRPKEEKAKGIKPAMELLRGPMGNEATRIFADTLEELRGPKVAYKTNAMIRAYVENSALLERHDCRFRNYLRSIVPDVYLPATDIVWAERLWRRAIERDFYNVGPALASYLICDWLLWLWRDGQIEWLETYKEDSVFLKAMRDDNLLPAAATDDFPAFCRKLYVPAEWIPARFWLTAFYPVPPRILNEAIWLELNGNQAAVESGPKSEERVVAGKTDTAEWPHRFWKLSRYKSEAFLKWVGENGGLEKFRQSPAYDFAVGRELIVNDEWNEDATLGSVDWTEQYVADWQEMARGGAFPAPDADLLRRLLDNAEYEEEGIADPYVFWPLMELSDGTNVKPRLLSVDGKTFVPVFTTLDHMQKSMGEDDPYRIKTPLSNVCRFFATLFQQGELPLGTVILNPHSEEFLALSAPFISRLSGEALFQTNPIDAGSILEVVPPSHLFSKTLLSRLSAVLRDAGWKNAQAVVIFFTDLRQSLAIGLPTENEKEIRDVWLKVDAAIGKEVEEFGIVAMLNSNMKPLFEKFGERL